MPYRYEKVEEKELVQVEGVRMSFEEQFPSLEREEYYLKDGTCVYANNMLEVQKHCLDKQKVQEAFDRMDKELEEWHDRSTIGYVLRNLKLDLGLK